ncbi:hypothetical protein B0H34DRAFT_696626 [Crassisporium funariophilum]|nr:hypothetical protein B0H34DRAFT_696626 [Crassisporium funariophilum]
MQVSSCSPSYTMAPQWKVRGRSQEVSVLRSQFNIAPLVQRAVELDDTTAAVDDLEIATHGVAAAARVSKRPRTPSPEPQKPQSHRNKKRAAKRAAKIAKEGHAPTERTIFEHVQLSTPVETTLHAESLPSALGAYSALRLRESAEVREKEYSLKELLNGGFRLVEWDGIDPRPLVDDRGLIYAVLAGRPYDSSYAKDATISYEAIRQAGERTAFHHSETKHRRGNFPALAVGISYGNGQGFVKRLNLGVHTDMMDDILKNDSIKRMAAYADSAFSVWAPRLYRHYRMHMEKLEGRTGITCNFVGSIFACATINFGPRVCTFKHRDSLNLPFGWCAILALGKFDPTLGGHLILWDTKTVIEFPPGSTILIPSATMSHSNVPVQERESRVSFTQYTAGGIFRYVDNDFRTEKEFEAEDKNGYEAMCELKKTRWKMGVSLFSSMDELLESI